MALAHALLATLVVTALSLACAAVGVLVLRGALTRLSSERPALRLGLGFFLGTALFASLWRLLAAGVGRADFALVVVSIGMVAFLLVPSVREDLGTLLRSSRSLSCLALACAAITLLFWTQDHNNFSVWAYLGSAHSSRAANIATHVWRTNAVPAFGQNYEQSLLAAVPLFLGLNQPIFTIWLWLCASLVALVVATHGLLLHLGLAPRVARLGTLLVLAGNVSLSVFFVRVFDNGTPLLLSGSVEVAERVPVDRRAIATRCVVVFSLFVSWALSAVQNTYLALGSLAAWTFFCLGRRRLPAKGVVLLGLAGLAITFAVVPLGGMLCPIASRDPAIPGVINYVSIPGKREFTINPTLPFTVGSEYWDKFLPVPGQTLSQLRRLGGEALRTLFYHFELSAWVAIKTAFFPMLGLVLLGFLLFGSDRGRDKPGWRGLWWASLVTFCLGFVVAFPLSVSWYRWGLTRFLISGYTLGAFCLVLTLCSAWESAGRAALPRAWRVLVALWLIGPIGGFAQQVASNLRSPARFARNVADMVSASGYFENDHHGTAQGASGTESSSLAKPDGKT